jgi:hypothetical protein
MHWLPFGAAISEAMHAMLKNDAVQAREWRPTAIPVIQLVEPGGDAMGGLRATSGRLNFHAEAVNRVAAHSNRPAPELEWAIYFLEWKYVQSVFVLGDLDVGIGDEAQAALQGRVLDLVGGKIITSAAT